MHVTDDEFPEFGHEPGEPVYVRSAHRVLLERANHWDPRVYTEVSDE